MKFSLMLGCILNMTITFSQAFPDRHSTNLGDSWLSCQPSPNPNSQRGNTHWIRYNLGDTYSLNKSTIWNFNVPERINSFDNQAWSLSPLAGRLEDGLKEIIIDMSTDGNTWTEWGRFTIPEAQASGFYQGVEGPDFQGKIAKYVLITGITNHGGTCFGLSEIRFSGTIATLNATTDISEEINITAVPNPFNQQTTIHLKGMKEGEIKIEVSDITGRKLKSFFYNVKSSNESLVLNRDGMHAGIYTLSIIRQEAVKTIKLQIQ